MDQRKQVVPIDVTQPLDESITFVVPVYNEAAGLRWFFEQFKLFVAQQKLRDCEFVFVNDGSSDDSLRLLQRIATEDARVKVVNLTRNYGKEIALTAGLDLANGELVVPIDADMQHPFEVITQFIQKWREGCDVVYAVQAKRQQGVLRKIFSRVFYRVADALGGDLSIPRGAGDFRLMTRAVVDKLNQLREQHRVMKGLYCLVGMKQAVVYFDANPRFEGDTKWSFLKLLNLSIDAITSFSTAPLRLATILGFLGGALSVVYALFTIIRTIAYGDPVAGYPTLVTVVLFLGSAQLICLGIIGEYLGRVFNETKQRPLYFVENIYHMENVEWRTRELDRERSAG